MFPKGLNMSEPIIIGLAGEVRSGKTTVAEYLADAYGMLHYENSDALKNILGSVGVSVTRENMYLVAQSLFESLGRDIIARGWMKRIKTFSNQTFVVSGIRYPEEIEVYKKSKNFRLFYVDCPLFIRKERFELTSKDSIKVVQDYQSEAFQEYLKENADCIIDNTRQLSDLEASLAVLMDREGVLVRE